MVMMRFLFSLVLLGFYPLQATYTLKDVLLANPEISEQKPSLLISKSTGSFVTIKGVRYQIRLFTFETKHIKDPTKNSITFGDFLAQHDQLSQLPKEAPETLHPVDFFASTPEIKKKEGYYFLLALRKMGNEEPKDSQ